LIERIRNLGSLAHRIWPPLHDPAQPNQDHSLELNLTSETLQFEEINGPLPDRGCRKPISGLSASLISSKSDSIQLEQDPNRLTRVQLDRQPLSIVLLNFAGLSWPRRGLNFVLR
jgi:hypothetical protein